MNGDPLSQDTSPRVNTTARIAARPDLVRAVADHADVATTSESALDRRPGRVDILDGNQRGVAPWGAGEEWLGG